MAIHYAFAHMPTDVLGLTTIFGNVFAWQQTHQRVPFSEQAHYSLDVIEGVLPPDPAFEPPSHHVHGKEGFGVLPAQTPQGNASGQNHRCVSV